MTAHRSKTGARPPSHPAAQLKELGLRAKKGLSQSFLADQGAARAIVQAAQLDASQDEVLEVGPGLGVLTRLLVQQARRVVAVELDRQLAEVLPASVAAENQQVHHADILEFDPSAPFEADFVVVANLPYHITSPALRHLLGAGPPHAKRLLLMVQREVADRVVARVGHLSAIAVFLQAQATIRIARHVPRGAFHPAPKVDSAVLQFEPLPESVRPVEREDLASFWSFLHAGFAQPRKTLGNSLAQGLAVEKPEAVALIDRAGIDPQRRPQQLTVQEWAHLFEVSRQ